MLGALANIFGDKGLLADERATVPFVTDWRGRRKGVALAVVPSATVREAAAFSTEHGVGRKLTCELSRFYSPLRCELMGWVKRMLDPHNLVNPGS